VTGLTKRWESDGFVVVEDMFPGDELEQMREQVDRLLTQPGVLPEHEIVYEPDSDPPRVRNAFRMHLYSEYFKELAHHPRLVAAMAELLGRPLRLYGSQIFAKPARVGTEVPWHQDMPYWPFAPAEMATAWIALDDTRIENGCVRFLRGSHSLGELPHAPSGVNGNSLVLVESALPRAMEEAPVEVKRGSCVIHHCLTVHRSEPNRSENSRRGLLYVYMSPRVAVTDASKLRGGTDFPVVAS
jgi:ectoine hydroxylase-related dioxygenase (phytanoyl-CoA dioxygenase family)